MLDQIEMPQGNLKDESTYSESFQVVEAGFCTEKIAKFLVWTPVWAFIWFLDS